MPRRSVAIPSIQIGLAAAYLVWVMSREAGKHSTGFGLALPAAFLGVVLLGSEIGWRRRQPVDSFAHVGRMISWGSFLIATGFAAVSAVLVLLVPDLRF